MNLPIDAIYEQFRHLPLSAIGRYCSSDRRLAQLCTQNAAFRRLISEKVVQPWIDKSGGDREEAFIKAGFEGDLTAVDHFLKLGTDLSYSRGTALTNAVGSQNIKMIDRLLQESRIKPSRALELAIEEGYLDMLERLLQDPRIDPSKNNNELFIYAIRIGATEAVKRLLQDKRIDPSANDNEAIQVASEEGQPDIVKLLLDDPRVDPTANENEAIIQAYEGNFATNDHNERDKYEQVIRLLFYEPRVYNTLEGPYRWRIADFLR